MTIDELVRDRTVSAEVRLTASLIKDELEVLAPTGIPTLIDVTPSSVGGSFADVDFVFEIAPGLTMLANFHPPIYGYDLAGNERSVAGLFCEQAINASLLTVDLEVKMGVISTCARFLVDDARARDLPTGLVSVHVSQFGFWVDPHDAQFLVTIETLSPNLQVRHSDLQVGNEDALRRLFADEMDVLCRRTMARNVVRDAGAHGTIDRLSLNAIASLGAVMPTLIEIADRNSMSLSDDVELLWDDGHLYSTGGEGARIGWMGNVLTVDQFLLPEIGGVAAVRRPITDLVSHCALTSDVLIRSVTSHEGEGLDFISLVLDVPEFFFNTELGAIWPLPLWQRSLGRPATIW